MKNVTGAFFQLLLLDVKTVKNVVNGSIATVGVATRIKNKGGLEFEGSKFSPLWYNVNVVSISYCIIAVYHCELAATYTAHLLVCWRGGSSHKVTCLATPDSHLVPRKSLLMPYPTKNC